MLTRPNKDIVEIFGYSPDDTTNGCRKLWKLGACPFIGKQCQKTNHDKSVTYGVCSVTTPYGDCVICPNRLYANNYEVLKRVSLDAFGELVPFRTYEQFVSKRDQNEECVVALGMNSGKEVKCGRSLSMDWVLARIDGSELIEYTGIEVQSIDITGNYRDNWYAYKHLSATSVIPPSGHGLNWANVHKRLIPQIIRKGLVYSKSNYVKSGLYFIVPDIVYKKFEEIIGSDIPQSTEKAPDIITVHTYKLSDPAPFGHIRELVLERTLRFSLEEFSQRFISGPNLPDATELDNAIRHNLGLE